MRLFASVAALSSAVVLAQVPAAPPRQAPAAQPVPMVEVRPIPPPATPLPDESASAGITRFSFIAYGDTRSGSEPGVPGDGQILHPQHSQLVDQMLALAKARESTPF